MTFAILRLVLSSVVKNPVSSITAIHVGCGITQLRVIVSTGNETFNYIFLSKFMCTCLFKVAHSTSFLVYHCWPFYASPAQQNASMSLFLYYMSYINTLTPGVQVEKNCILKTFLKFSGQL